MYLYLLLVFVVVLADPADQLREALKSECVNPDKKVNSGLNLFFMTPWKEDGTALALKYAKKIDILSPAWFELDEDEIDKVKFPIVQV